MHESGLSHSSTFLCSANYPYLLPSPYHFPQAFNTLSIVDFCVYMNSLSLVLPQIYSLISLKLFLSFPQWHLQWHGLPRVAEGGASRFGCQKRTDQWRECGQGVWLWPGPWDDGQAGRWKVSHQVDSTRSPEAQCESLASFFVGLQFQVSFFLTSASILSNLFSLSLLWHCVCCIH